MFGKDWLFSDPRGGGRCCRSCIKKRKDPWTAVFWSILRCSPQFPSVIQGLDHHRTGTVLNFILIWRTYERGDIQYAIDLGATCIRTLVGGVPMAIKCVCLHVQSWIREGQNGIQLLTNSYMCREVFFYWQKEREGERERERGREKMWLSLFMKSYHWHTRAGPPAVWKSLLQGHGISYM